MRFSYMPAGDTGILMPFMPFQFVANSALLDVMGLIDSGSSMNVLPYDIGVRLGAVWEQQPISLTLGGNLANFEARALTLEIIIPGLSDVPAKQGFAWSRGSGFPIILGQVNFFLTFNVCFYRSQGYFEVSSKTT
jgi:hypothetical protein